LRRAGLPGAGVLPASSRRTKAAGPEGPRLVTEASEPASAAQVGVEPLEGRTLRTPALRIHVGLAQADFPRVDDAAADVLRDALHGVFGALQGRFAGCILVGRLSVGGAEGGARRQQAENCESAELRFHGRTPVGS